MAKAVKQHGRVYTPDYMVNLILDFGNYNGEVILRKHVIDNSCGDGAFLQEIVKRYCNEYLKHDTDLAKLKKELQKYIHGIELGLEECLRCIDNLNNITKTHGITSIDWNIINADTLTIDDFNGKMDYVFGNPPYVRVHNLESSYDSVKKFKFAEGGMTDLFIVFFEIGFNMLAKDGLMCLITPSSWLSSIAGNNLRNYIMINKNISGIIDLEHFQPFEATTYTLISRFIKSKKHNHIEYYTYDDIEKHKVFQDELSYSEIQIV